MGIVGSKDEAGKVILGNLPPGFLDEKGRKLRDELDACLEQNMWFFSIGGLLLTMPICIKYKTERPFFAAAIMCPVADMYYGTLRCTKENEAFREHYKYLQEVYNQPLSQRQQQQELQQERKWRPHEEQEEQQLQQQQQQQQSSSWWWQR